mmetsp:Transcript_89859/g.232048  ORF Transcript_89859/g.232048 Transcript_89859/m.232048 type:complete len:456 (+) Transcript_89859:46-1413(+)
MPLRHVVLLKFQAGTAEEKKAALVEGLEALPKAIPEIAGYKVGVDAGVTPEGNHDFSIVGDFASEQDYQVYAKHPAHQAVIVNLVKPILAPGGRAAVQYRTEPDNCGVLADTPEFHEFRQRLCSNDMVFADTLAFIDMHFDYAPRAFSNGGVDSAAGTNAGSCKVFSMGKLLGLNQQQVLAAFGEHHRQVCGDPTGSSHANIRAFMKHSWDGVTFPDGLCLSPGPFQEYRRQLCNGSVKFADTLAMVDLYFDYTPRNFSNGNAFNAAGTNEGSCKAFSLGKLLGLSKQQMLAAFGEHYLQVCGDPGGASHGNIREFMKHGWDRVRFPDGLSLSAGPLQAYRKQISGGETKFADTLAAIDAHFDYTKKPFVNGGTESAAGANEGSCKLFSFGRLTGLSQGQLLAAFGEHYQQVRGDPTGSSHGNIRAFMKRGWEGVSFPDGLALTAGSAAKRRKVA